MQHALEEQAKQLKDQIQQLASDPLRLRSAYAYAMPASAAAALLELQAAPAYAGANAPQTSAPLGQHMQAPMLRNLCLP